MPKKITEEAVVAEIQQLIRQKEIKKTPHEKNLKTGGKPLKRWRKAIEGTTSVRDQHQGLDLSSITKKRWNIVRKELKNFCVDGDDVSTKLNLKHVDTTSNKDEPSHSNLANVESDESDSDSDDNSDDADDAKSNKSTKTESDSGNENETDENKTPAIETLFKENQKTAIKAQPDKQTTSKNMRATKQTAENSSAKEVSFGKDEVHNIPIEKNKDSEDSDVSKSSNSDSDDD